MTKKTKKCSTIKDLITKVWAKIKKSLAWQPQINPPAKIKKVPKAKAPAKSKKVPAKIKKAPAGSKKSYIINGKLATLAEAAAAAEKDPNFTTTKIKGKKYPKGKPDNNKNNNVNSKK